MPCMRKSVTTTCGRDTDNAASAASPLSNAVTAYPDALNRIAINCSNSLSSTGISLGFSLLIAYAFSSRSSGHSCRLSLRGVGERTRRTARKCDTEMTAASLGHDGDLAAVRLDELARDGEAEAAALDAHALALAAATEEQIEDRLTLLGRHARSRIDHLDHRLARLHARLDGDSAARWSELDCVADEVVDDRAQLVRIRLEHGWLGVDL